MAITGNGPLLIWISSAFMVLNTVFIGLRIYTRVAITRHVSLNDYLIVLALLAYAALLALAILGAEGGLGGHLAGVAADPAKFRESLKYLFFLEIIYVILTSAMKVSIALTFLEWTKNKFLRTLLWISIFLDFAISAAFIGYLLLQCKPISYAWELTDPTKKGTCLPLDGQLYMGYALSFVTILLDSLFLIAPWFMLRNSGLNQTIKLYIYGIWGLAVLASIANVIRLAGLKTLKESKEPLLDAAPVFWWSAAEVSIGIIVAGILELGPLMRKMNVKGFEDYTMFATLGDDDMEPINLKSMDKSQIHIVHTTNANANSRGNYM
ncbi:hypothetical protein HYFRA_00008682 [Hymenoscyphus fraxineus]|uniref:Rhodopsin domain-containing protein n=1 Tax=Hymenoscyphus fraxineus TaxID=746836 RepID=A0A9N9KY95_9HELO|nr:hypothetical protein HYFRA_00008682 [Hymenoscyphus fraxineus]